MDVNAFSEKSAPFEQFLESDPQPARMTTKALEKNEIFMALLGARLVPAIGPSMGLPI